jgi:hypothetical protein
VLEGKILYGICCVPKEWEAPPAEIQNNTGKRYTWLHFNTRCNVHGMATLAWVKLDLVEAKCGYEEGSIK